MNTFYQLPYQEWVEVCRELKPAEIKVLYLLRTLDPFGDRPVKFKVVDIANEIGINKGTVSRAIQVLGEKGYINLEIVEAIATLTTKSKKLSTDQKVVCTQQLPEKVVCRQQNELKKVAKKLSTDHSSCVQTTSAIATQPDDPQSLTQIATDFSHTIHTNKTNQIRSRDENFDLKDHEIETKDDQEIAIENKDDPEKDFKDFIIKTIERKRKITIASRDAYLNKVLAKDAGKWRSLYAESKKPVSKPRDLITGDIWRLEQSLNQAIRMNDLEFAIAKLEGLTDIREQLFDRHPEWRELLCG